MRNAHFWFNSKSIRSSTGQRDTAGKAAHLPCSSVRCCSVFWQCRVCPHLCWPLLLTYLGKTKALFLRAECLSLAGAGKGRTAKMPQSRMLTLVLAFILFSLFFVHPGFHFNISSFSFPVHGSSEAALDASKTPAWLYLPAPRPAAQGPPLHLPAGGMPGPPLDPQVHCGCYHIPCHGRWCPPSHPSLSPQPAPSLLAHSCKCVNPASPCWVSGSIHGTRVGLHNCGRGCIYINPLEKNEPQSYFFFLGRCS